MVRSNGSARRGNMVRSNGSARRGNIIQSNGSARRGNTYIKMLLNAAKVYNNWQPKKSKFLYCVVNKQFYIDRQLKTFTGKIISGNRDKCRVYWNDGHITTVQLKNELRNGTIKINTGNN